MTAVEDLRKHSEAAKAALDAHQIEYRVLNNSFVINTEHLQKLQHSLDKFIGEKFNLLELVTGERDAEAEPAEPIKPATTAKEIYDRMWRSAQVN